MALVIILQICACLALVWVARTRGFDHTLPIAACLLVAFPGAVQFHIPGMFDLTAQRVIVLTLIGLAIGERKKAAASGEQGALPMRYLLLATAAWMLLASVVSVVPAISIKSTLSQCLDYFALYAVYVRNIQTIQLAKNILMGVVAGCAVCSLFGLLEIYAGWKVTSLLPPAPTRFAPMEELLGRGERVQSTFDHAILFGSALVFAIPMAMYLLEKEAPRGRKAMLWCSLGAMSLCLFKTSSRGPWLALLLSMAALIVFGNTRFRGMIASLCILAGLVMFIRPGVRESITDLYAETRDPDSPQGESYQWRYVLYDVANRELSKNMGRSLWGYGPESFYYLNLTADFTVEGQLRTVKVESCDSAIVELMMGTGYVGLALVAIMFIRAMAASLSGWRQGDGNAAALGLVLCVNLCAFVFLMTNVDLFAWGQQAYVLWIVMALAFKVPQFARADAAEPVDLPYFARSEKTTRKMNGTEGQSWYALRHSGAQKRS